MFSLTNLIELMKSYYQKYTETPYDLIKSHNYV